MDQALPTIYDMADNGFASSALQPGFQTNQMAHWARQRPIP